VRQKKKADGAAKTGYQQKEPALNEQEISRALDTLVGECMWHFSNSGNYESLKGEFQSRENKTIKPIGEKLHKAGGMALMREVYEQVEARCGRSCRSALDMKWNGVGNWMS